MRVHVVECVEQGHLGAVIAVAFLMVRIHGLEGALQNADPRPPAAVSLLLLPGSESTSAIHFSLPSN